MKLLDLGISFEERNLSTLNLFGQRFSLGVLLVEQFGKRQQQLALLP
jgi:hypothetical protein